MSELQRRSFYQPQSVSQGYNPTRAADMTPGLRANQQRMLQEQKMMNDASLSDLKRQQEQAKLRQFAQSKEAEQLVGLSQTLFDTVLGIRKDQISNKEAEMRTLFLQDEQKRQEAALLSRQVDQQMSEVHQGNLDAADRSAEVDAPYSVTERLRNLNRWDEHHYRILAAKSAGENYASWADEQKNTRTDTFMVGNVEIQINDPQNDIEAAAVDAQLNKEYNQLPEVAAIGLPYLAEHAAPQWRKYEQKSLAAFQKQYAIDKSIDHRAEAFNLYSSTFRSNEKAFPQLFQTLRTTVDKDGKRLGNHGAWKVIRKYFKDQEDRGVDIADELAAAMKTPIPGDKKGRTYGELYAKTQWNPLMEEMGDERRTNFRNQQTDAKQKHSEYQQEVITELSQQEEPVTTAQLDEAIKGANELAERLGIYGEKPSALINFRGEATIEAQQLKEKIRQYEFLQSRNMLDPNTIAREGLEIQKRFMQPALTQAQQRTMVTKPGDKAIKGYITGTAEVSVFPDGSTSGITELVVADAQATVNRRAQEIYALNPEAGFQSAFDQAFVEWKATYDEGIKDPKSKYYASSKGWVNFLPNVTSVSNSLKRTNERIETINGTYEALGTSALASPGLFGDENFFQQLENNYGKPGWRMPPVIAHFAKKLNVSPFQIINEQRKALKMTELPEYRNLIFNDQQPPEYRRFINDLVEGKATQDRMNRFTGAPLPIRESVSSMLPQNNVMKFRRAIISQESGGSYSVVNPDSGAIGAGQVMPENVGPWTQKYLGRRLTPQEFRFNPAAQDIVINGRFKDMLTAQMQAGYNEEQAVRRAAAEWYSGQPDLWDNTRPQYSGGRRYPSIAEYTSSIWAKYQSN